MINLEQKQTAPIILTQQKIKYLSDVKLPPKSMYNMEEHGVTQSLLKNSNCRLRLILWLNGWYLPEKEYKTSWGSLFHKMLDKLYSTYKEQKLFPTKEDIYNWVDQYYKEIYKDTYFIEQDKEYLDIIKAVVLLKNYTFVYEEDFTEQESIMIESSFSVKFFDFLLRGKIDREFIKNNDFWLMEHKTKSRINEGNLLDLLSIDFQNMFYLLARLLTKQILYKGVEYNIIRNPSSNTLNNNSFEEFEKSFEADVQKRPQYYYKRFIITFCQKCEIETFKQNLKYKLEELFLILNGKLPIYPNLFSCEDPWPCPYIRACASGVLTGYRQKEKLFEELEEV